MRTSQREVSRLVGEIRTGIGARTNSQAWEHVAKARASIERRLIDSGFSGVQLSPYRNGCWTLSALGAKHTTSDGVLWVSANTTAEEIMDSPFSLAKRFISRFCQ